MESSPPIEEIPAALGNRAINQAIGLPEKIEIDMFSNMDRLEEPEDFCLWLRNMTRLLKTAGLDKLIDIHIPRPEGQNEESKRWLLYSKLVQHYLSESVADDLLHDIVSLGKHIKLADEFVDQAKRAFQTPGVYADLDGIASICSIQLSNHKTPQDFVWEFREHFKRLWNLKIGIPPYVAICNLINQLDTMETKFVVALTIADLHKRAEKVDLWTQFKQVDFYVVSFNIIQRLEADAQDQNMQELRSPPQENVKNKLDIESFEKNPQDFEASLNTYIVKAPIIDQPVREPKRFTNADRKHFPKAGVNRAAYAQHLRETLGALPNKECAYCGQKFHTAAKCFYLNPSSRPKQWKPDPRIWVFMYGVAGEEEVSPLKMLISSPTESKKTLLLPERKSSEHWTEKGTVETLMVKKLKEAQLEKDKLETIAMKNPEDSSPENKQVKVKMPAEIPTGLKQEKGAKEEAVGEDSMIESVNRCDTDSPFVGTAFDTSNSFTASKPDWLVVQGRGYHVCADLSVMTEYHEYGPDDTPFRWTWNARGQRSEAQALGKGKARISLLLQDRVSIMQLHVDCVYCPDARFSLFFIEKAEKNLLIRYNEETKTLHDLENDMSIIGFTVNEKGLPFLGTLNSTIQEVNLMDMD
ncbi:uncharacterized protein N7484_003226 [Penicillium longicatenatum]|uniref:uncharacterized protein n=1 Tax=Penicillium longicatenatum TaxID=1561947 RepID=UPI0025473E3E|nr:uncharacterized protein N7484_003226 [Penicillium longicatenatum]KAJ5649503.1 hypothetical protein N7484_003226 [Penicillium longicatenatum]